MFVRLTHALLAAGLILAAAGGADAQSLRLVAIQDPSSDAMTDGVGVLRPRYTGECFVVTPRHVADPGRGANAGFRAVGVQGNRDSLLSVADRYSDDLAVWRMPRRVDRSSCPEWPGTADVNRTLERAARRGTDATVLPWTAQGAGQPVRVIMEQLTLTRFTVRQTRGGLTEGMSGSPVQVDGMVVGILTEVNDDDRGGSVGVVLRLDYLERHFGPFFHPSISPNHAAIYGSVLLPGLGQERTHRVQAGLFWFGIAAGPSAYLLLHTRDEQVARTRTLPDGREETYFETRPTRPYRGYSWIPWLAAGFGSYREARTYAARHYIPPERSGARRARGARVHLRPDVQPAADGATRVQLGELRF
jgi:hypothetical protein